MTRAFNRSGFWRRWFLTGLVAGMLAGLVFLIIVPVTLNLYRQILLFVTVSGLIRLIGEFAALGGVYALGQAFAQYFSLNPYIPRQSRSLRANFLGTVIGVVVTGILLLALILAGFGDFLAGLGLSLTLSLILQAFIVGGFGGIAQAIVVRAILGQRTEAGYFRWILPLALLGHVSGGLVGIGVWLIAGQFFP